MCDEFPRLMESNGRWACRRFEEINLIVPRERVNSYFKVRKRAYHVLTDLPRPFTLKAEIMFTTFFTLLLETLYVSRLFENRIATMLYRPHLIETDIIEWNINISIVNMDEQVK